MQEADTDDELFFQPKTEQGVLFGAAYENKYIDILENDEINDFDEINEKMLEISLGMTKEELSQLTKIEIKVDTTNTHMQYVGEILQSLTLLKLNDSVIPSMRDLGTSFRSIQVLYLNRWEMKTLAGLSWFEFLKELYISYNDIDDIFDIGFCNNLEVLDLEGNDISAWDNISYLAGCSKLVDLNISNNPISNDQNYQNRVKELLPQLKYLDDLHIGAIRTDQPILSYSKLEDFSLSVIEEKYFILSKFSKFSIGIDELEQLAAEALDWITDEEHEETILKTQIKRHERKNEAFENETFEMFDAWQDSEFDNDYDLDSSKLNDTQQKMFRSWTNGFMSRKSSDLIADDLNVSKFSAYDDSSSMLRSSMQGFFTGRKKKDFFATKESTYNTCDGSEDLSPEAYNEYGGKTRHTKAHAQNKKISLTNTGYSDNIEAKGIKDLLFEFNTNTNNFKQSMQSIDVASKLKENSQYSRAESCLTEVYDSPERPSKLSEKYRMFSQYQSSGKKVVPIKADRIIIKRHTIKSEDQ